MLTLLLALALAAQPRTGGEDVWFAHSADGLAFTAPTAGVLSGVRAPDILELSGAGAAGEKGTLVVYALDARPHLGRREGEPVRAVSTDGGKTWSSAESAPVEGRPPGPSLDDIAAVQLPDGRVRLYYTLSRATIDPGFPPDAVPGGPRRPRDKPSPEPPLPEFPPIWPPEPLVPPVPRDPITLPVKVEEEWPRLFSAVSTDGVKFTAEEGVRLELPTLVSPEMLFTPSTPDGGQWLLFYRSGGEAKLARSRDGLAFEGDGDFSMPAAGPVTAMTLLDGRVRLFVGSGSGLTSATYDPRTQEVRPEAGMRLSGRCSVPSVASKAGGGYVLVFTRPLPIPR